MSDRQLSSKNLPTVGQALDHCSQLLEGSDAFFGHGTDNAWDEAVQLVLSVAELPLDSGEAVLPRQLDAKAAERLDTLLSRRINEHVPLPYLLGRAWFAGLEFSCDSRAIIPRSPIAELVLSGFQPWYSGPEPTRVLDLCCGGGAIGLATAHYFPHVTVDLLDIDTDALDLARENAEHLAVEERVNIIQSDLFEAISAERYDLILCNPPYVDAADLAAMPVEFHHEPERSLGSGDDGLDLTRNILVSASKFLRDSGLLILEVGNSWVALERAYPSVPFTWLEFEHGGEGVCALSAQELQEYSTRWRE